MKNKLITCSIITELNNDEPISILKIEYVKDGIFCEQTVPFPRGVNPVIYNIFLGIIEALIKQILEGD